MKLSPTQIEHFNSQGYLIIENVLSDAELDPVRVEYTGILDREAPRLVEKGVLSQTYAHLPFEERYTAMLHEMDDMYTLYQHLDISLPLTANIPADTQLNTGPATFYNILRNAKILDIAESVLGPELYSNPTQHTRIKPPVSALPDRPLDSNVHKTYWHQDEAVLTDDALESNMLTVWIAMTDATLENGCMMCVPRSHIENNGTMHCPGLTQSASEIFIPEDLIAKDQIVYLPVKKGGVVLLHQRTQHAALDNNSDRIRWSFDLRFNKIGQATGRHWFPGFVARSKANPEQELNDVSAWADLWYAARDELSQMEDIGFNSRWTPFGEHALCA